MTNELICENKFPILKTARLTLRPFNMSDAKEVQRMAGNKKVFDMTATIPHPYLDGMAEEWISKHSDWFLKDISVDWAIELNESKKLVGNLSLILNLKNSRSEIGYWIGEEFWNKGFCTEAMIAAVKYAFEIKKLNKITCRHIAINPASGKVMTKAGMIQEGYLKQDSFRDNQFQDMVVYGLLKSDWILKK